MKFLTEKYDHKEQWDKEAQPLIEQLHAIAGRMNIPLIVAAVVKNDGKSNVTISALHQPGPERTPPEFSIGFCFVREGIKPGRDALLGYAMMQVADADADAEPEDKTA